MRDLHVPTCFKHTHPSAQAIVGCCMQPGGSGPSGWRLLVWVGVAVAAHVLVALFGVMNRWLQVKPTPPLPALRLALLVTSLGLASMLLLDASLRCGKLARRTWQRSRDRRIQQPGHRAAAADVKHASLPSTRADVGSSCRPAPSAAVDAEVADPASGSLRRQRPGPHQQRSDGAAEQQPGEAPPPRPELPLVRGLSRRVREAGRGRPRLVYNLALAATTLTFSTAFLCQVAAPGFVDAAVVQLAQMFVVVGVALFQRLLLRYQLPTIIWPASLLMLGGAAMVIVPSIGSASSGGIAGWRGWLGFGLSLCSMASTILYFCSLQAFRGLGFTSAQLQYCYLVFCTLLLLPLTLPIDGTDWSSQFGGWSASSWAMLVLVSSVVCIGANYCLQHATWQLGAPTISMFYGLRLVASILLSKALLGATLITDAVQIVGAIVTVAAVTVYLAFQWRDSRRAAARAAADKAAEAGCAVEEGGAGTAVLPHKAGAGLHAPPAAGASLSVQEESHPGSAPRL